MTLTDALTQLGDSLPANPELDSDHQAALRIVVNAHDDLNQLLRESFRHFGHLDHSNAAVHCSPVRYSPITFRLAERIEQLGRLGLFDGHWEAEMLDDVLRDVGQYPEDRGRIADEPEVP